MQIKIVLKMTDKKKQFIENFGKSAKDIIARDIKLLKELAKH